MHAGHRFLNRMQHAVVGKIFDRDQFGAIELTEQRDARIDRLVDHAAIAFAHDDDGAGAAIAFGAALLGAGRSFLQPQPVEHGRARRKFADPDIVTVAPKLQEVSCHERGAAKSA